MKRIKQILITSTLLALMLMVSAVGVLAKGGDEIPLQISAVELSTETTHFGETLVATVSVTSTTSLDNYTVIIDWGDGTVEEESFSGDEISTISGQHLYTQPGQYWVVVIVVLPFDEGTVASEPAGVKVLTAHETVDLAKAAVEHLVNANNLSDDQGESLLASLTEAQVELAKERIETAVEHLNEYRNELSEFIESGLVPKEDPSATIVDDLANVLLADPRSSP